MTRSVSAALGVFLLTSVALAADHSGGEGKVLRFRKDSIMDPPGIGVVAESTILHFFRLTRSLRTAKGLRMRISCQSSRRLVAASYRRARRGSFSLLTCQGSRS
jgi:hypothetical protein